MNLGPLTWLKAHVCGLNPTYVARVSKAIYGNFYAFKVEVLSESHIPYEPPKTPFFTL